MRTHKFSGKNTFYKNFIVFCIVKNWIKISIALLIEFYELIELYGDAYQESSQWAETFFFICDFCHKNKDIGKKEQSQKDDSLILLNNQFYHNSPCSQKHKNGRNDELKLYRYVLFIHFFFCCLFYFLVVFFVCLSLITWIFLGRRWHFKHDI